MAKRAFPHHRKARMAQQESLNATTEKRNTLKDKGLAKNFKKRVFAPDEPAACE